uniref:Uncharacterized protein n=1 Tax=Arundo donax TaxID=35708 RepID=A0A0A9AKN4_ARUDO
MTKPHFGHRINTVSLYNNFFNVMPVVCSTIFSQVFYFDF